MRVISVPRLDHGLFSTESQHLALAELYRFLGLPAAPAPATAARRAFGAGEANPEPAL